MADRRLLDQFGTPIAPETIAVLREEISATAAIAGRPPFPGHRAFGIDPQRLGAIIRAADSGNTMEWMILAEEIEELFSHYQAVLSKRRRQVSQLSVTVVDADETQEGIKHGQLVRDWIKTGLLHHALFDITDAIGRGYSVHEIIWASEPGRVWPARLEYRPQRYFELSWEDGATLLLRDQGAFVPLLAHKFLTHKHPSKSGQAQRSGLTRMVAWLWMYSAFTLRDWSLFCQGYGLPVRVGRYGPEAGENDKRVLWRAVSSIAGDVAAIIPKSMEIEFVRDGDRAGGTELYLKRADWLNREVSKLVLGGTAGTEAIHGGHAVGQEHRAAEADVERFDGGLLANSITRQIVQPMVAFTFGPQADYPRVVIGEPDRVPLTDVVEAIADLGGMGLKVKASQIRERLQLDEPKDGDEIIGGPPAQVPKPDIPAPVRMLPADGHAARPFLGRLISQHAAHGPDALEALTDRLAQDAAGALAGMTAQVRHQFDVASDMHDLAARLHRLNLPIEQFAEAMARGMALAHMVGQAELLDELHPHAAAARGVR